MTLTFVLFFPWRHLVYNRVRVAFGDVPPVFPHFKGPQFDLNNRNTRNLLKGTLFAKSMHVSWHMKSFLRGIWSGLRVTRAF